MECPRCHNQNMNDLYQFHGQYYCRKCIQFHKVDIHTKRLTKRITYPNVFVSYTLGFELSPRQKEISQGLVECFQNKENAYVWAVCGSGKTEIVFEVIRYALNTGHRVCFCVPRKELVRELYERMKDAFSNIEIGLLYGGTIENMESPFVVCTMHQLYRFENNVGFDLMIADEIDAFPFYQNEVLESIFHQCCLGNFVKMSATIEERDIKDGRIFILNRRYHGHDLPVPRLMLLPQLMYQLVLLFLIKINQIHFIIYVPTIHKVEEVVHFLRKHHISCAGVSSKSSGNQEKINMLKENQIQVLVSTTLLERGITIENVHVIVLWGNHRVFHWKTLVQIAGRVGRKPNYPSGHVYILSPERTKDIQKCVSIIKRLNRMSV